MFYSACITYETRIIPTVPRTNSNNRARRRCLPEEVVPAEQLRLPGEAFVDEGRMAVVTPDAVGVPRPLQYVQQELVQDGLVAARAGDQHTCCRLAPTCNAKITSVEQTVRRRIDSEMIHARVDAEWSAFFGYIEKYWSDIINTCTSFF